MSKWKCEICGSEFDNFQAQGFEGTIYCPLCYFKKLYKDTELERERLNNIINELENTLKYEISKSGFEQDYERKSCYEDILDEIQELKGSDKK